MRLAVDINITPHTDPANMPGNTTKFTLPDITVDMRSGTNTLIEDVHVLFSQLAITQVYTASPSGANNGHSAEAEGTKEDSRVIQHCRLWGTASFAVESNDREGGI